MFNTVEDSHPFSHSDILSLHINQGRENVFVFPTYFLLIIRKVFIKIIYSNIFIIYFIFSLGGVGEKNQKNLKKLEKKSYGRFDTFRLQRTVHEIFGGGLVADVILWRQKNVTMGILLVALASWVVFERSGYTLLSLVSSVLLLLFAILFLWAKSAAILNRPAPPLPELHLSEETVNEIAAFIRTRLNVFLSVSQDIALGKDTNLFFKVAGCLLLISIVGGLADFLTLGYTSLLIILTIPALYEKYEDFVDKYVKMVSKKSQQLYVKFDVEFIGGIRKWILEKQKLS